MNIVLLLFFGIIPSIIWLLFYLRKDANPESNQMILKVFLYGMVATGPAALIELGIAEELNRLNFSSFLISLVYIFIGIALVEEILKYLVFKGKVERSSELDEPLDIMLYMIISALGFAALENILVLLSLSPPFIFLKTLSISIIRFISATFLHALCSGAFGFFLAFSFFQPKKRVKLFLAGITMATLLHGLYNFSIIKIETSLTAGEEAEVSRNLGNPILYFFIIIFILLGLAIFVSWGFKKLKKLKSVCQTN